MFTIQLKEKDFNKLMNGNAVCVEHLRQRFIDATPFPPGCHVSYLVNWEIFQPFAVEIHVMQGLQCTGLFTPFIHVMNIYRYTERGLHEPKLYIITESGLRKVKETLLQDSGYYEY